MWTRRAAMEHPYGRRPCDVDGLRRTLVTAERVYLIDLTQRYRGGYRSYTGLGIVMVTCHLLGNYLLWE